MKTMIKNFNLFRRENKKENQPDYDISVKFEESYIKAGACWLKEKNGKKFLSCKLNDDYSDHTNSKNNKRGFNLSFDTKVEEGEATKQEIDTMTSEDENGKKTNLKDIPF